MSDNESDAEMYSAVSHHTASTVTSALSQVARSTVPERGNNIHRTPSSTTVAMGKPTVGLPVVDEPVATAI